MRAFRPIPTVAVGIVTSLTIAGTVSTATAASASSNDRSASASAAVQGLAKKHPTLVRNTAMSESGNAVTSVSDTLGRRVQLSKSGTVSFRSTDGTNIGVTPKVDGLSTVPKLQGSVFVYEGARGVSTTVAIGKEGTQIFCVFMNRHSPDTCKFKFNLPKSYKLVVNKDGSASVINKENKGVLKISAPFAYDKKGARVNTAYSAAGDTLTQTVAHRSGNFSYPVVADPGIDWAKLGTFVACFTGAGGSIAVLMILFRLGGVSALWTVARFGIAGLPKGFPWWGTYIVPIIQRCAWAIRG